MNQTNHFRTRCHQRNISSFEVELALSFGMITRDKHVLGEKYCQALIAAADEWEKVLQRAGKGEAAEKLRAESGLLPGLN